MSLFGNGRMHSIHLLATFMCGIIGLVALLGGIICRLNRVEAPSGLDTIVGVVITALAVAVPTSSQRDPLSPPPSPPGPISNSPQ